MPANSDFTTTKTSLDYSAEGYWQDFLAQRPIAGGIVYESQLRACNLDESLASLQRIDTLLSQIRRDIVKKTVIKKSIALTDHTEDALLADDRFRHLLWFLAFYAGRVLANHWQSVAHWYNQSELRRRYPELSFNREDFYQEMAMVYGNSSKSSESEVNQAMDKAAGSLFFALEPIGLRLFGHIDRQFVAVQSSPVASGLYQAVIERLPETPNPTTLSKPLAQQATDKPKEANDEFVQIVASSLVTARLSGISKPISTKKDNNSAVEISTDHTHSHVAREVNNQSTSDQKIVYKQSQKTTASTPEMFTRLLTELVEIDAPQSAGIEEYQQAVRTLDQFERHLAKQDKPRAQVRFSDTHQAARQQALILLMDSANKGNTSAMLRLAMYELLGEGLTAHDSSAIDTIKEDKPLKQVGVILVEQAANAKDSRAQRLLSKLYYQGFGLEQDMAMGKYWLEQAADNGHPEAITIDQHWQQAQALIMTKAQEQHSLKRYQLLIAIVIVAALLLIVFV